MTEVQTVVSHQVAHPRQQRCKFFGEEIQMDGSLHLWFGDRKAVLHLAVDNAARTIVGAFFDWQETLNGYYHVFGQILFVITASLPNSRLTTVLSFIIALPL